MPRRKLEDIHREFIVVALARNKSVTQVVKDLKEQFQIDVAKPTICSYDPKNVIAQKLDQKWRDLFTATRERYIQEVSEHGIYHQSVRLGMLNEAANDAKDKGNYPLMAQLLEQAAKDLGGLFTNRREHTGANGGPIQMSIDDKRKKLANALGITPEQLPSADTVH